MVGAGAEVVVRGGQLVLRALSPIPALYRGFPLRPDDENDPYVFRIDLSEFGMGMCRVIFSRGSGKATTRVHLDPISVSLEKRPAARNRRLWVSGALAVAAVAIAVRRRGAVTV